MFMQAIEDKKSELGVKSQDYKYLQDDVHKTVRYELEKSGYGQQYVEKQYTEWVRMYSKNPIRQEFLENELSDVKWKYQNFKDGIK